MSRCFPFPPPGYVNKAKPDDSSFFIKEKHKHKKRQDKDREKKERSERKDKERSKGKHKEDKDRKQKKHRDKDKKREKRKSSEEEKKIVGPSEDQNGENPGPDNKPGDVAHGRKFLAELGKRVRNDDDVGSSENQNGEMPGPDSKPGDGARSRKFFVETGKRVRNDDGPTDKKDKKKQKSSEEKRVVGPLGNQNGEKPGPDNRPGDGGAHDCRIMVEMGKRVRNDDGANDNSHVSTANGQSLRDDAKCSGNNRVGNFSGENRIKVENRDKNRKDDEKRKKEEKMEVKERRKGPEPVLNGLLHENGTRPDSVSRPAISSHRDGQNGNGSHPSQKNTIPLTMEKRAVFTNQKVNDKLLSSQSVVRDVRYIESGQTANNSGKPGLLRARLNNHAGSNGFISSHPLVEDERKMAVPNNTDKTVDGPRPGNGLLEGKKDISSRPSTAFIKKAPHPDSKYLSQILTVPKLDSPRFDDEQDWLLGRKDAKKPTLGPSEVECTKRVWAEAIRLEHADVTVLPYVVPY